MDNYDYHFFAWQIIIIHYLFLPFVVYLCYLCIQYKLFY